MKKLVKTSLIKNKFYFWYQEKDKYVGQRIALDKYEPYLTKLMLSKIKNGDVVVDIGANIGYDTVLMADKVGKKGKVISIEPDPTNFEILQKNIRENKLMNVVVVQAAVGKENKKMKIFESEENFGDHRMWENPSDQTLRPAGTSLDREAIRKTKDVFCRRLDDLLKELDYKKVDFIKIDVQGFEMKALIGGEKIISKNIPTIFFEYWPWGIKNAGDKAEDLIKFLRKIYKKIFWVEEYIQVHFPISDKFLKNKYRENEENDYGNLFVKDKRDWVDFVEQFCDFWPKKLLKMILGRPRT